MARALTSNDVENPGCLPTWATTSALPKWQNSHSAVPNA